MPMNRCAGSIKDDDDDDDMHGDGTGLGGDGDDASLDSTRDNERSRPNFERRRCPSSSLVMMLLLFSILSTNCSDIANRIDEVLLAW